MLTLEARLREELRNCAVELRQLAYTLQKRIRKTTICSQVVGADAGYRR